MARAHRGDPDRHAAGPLELHAAYVPWGDWTQVDILSGMYEHLARASSYPRIVCEDFKGTRAEHPDGTMVTWASRAVRGRVTWPACASGSCSWVSARFDLQDVYRALQGYGT